MDSVTSLALTYALHAVVWAAASALLTRAPWLSPSSRHRCWKVALFGPPLSATLATAWSGHSSAVAGGVPAIAAAALEVPVHPSPSTRAIAVWVAIVCSVMGLLRFGGAAAGLRRHLQDRRDVTEPVLRRTFDALCRRMRLGEVRLTECAGLGSPLVLGAREVCVPLDLLGNLNHAEVEVVLAHELAHVERRDGIWFPLAGALQLALWFQPLNHVVSARFRRTAELSCDDRAVELTRDPRALARAILSLAERASLATGQGLAPSIVRGTGDVGFRVQRLASMPAHAQEQRRWTASSSAALAGVALFALSVRVVSGSPELGSRLGELAAREQQLSATLFDLSQDAAAGQAGAPEWVRVLELEQELRHVHAMQAWLEQSR